MNEVPLPLEVLTLAEDLQGSLGDFWRRMYKDTELIRRCFSGNALAAAQAVLDLAVSDELRGLRSAPALHRTLWTPVAIRKSQRDTAEAFALRLGQGAQLGPQSRDSGWSEGKVFTVGSSSALHGCVSYPLPKDVLDLDRVFDVFTAPQTTLVRGVHFYTAPGGIAFLPEHDPFDGSSFPVRQIQNPDGSRDSEVVIWISNARRDKDWLTTHYGSTLGLEDGTPEQVRALWRTTFNPWAETRQLLNCLHKFLGFTCAEGPETVTWVQAYEAEHLVVTDKKTYVLGVPPLAHVVPGAQLQLGDALTPGITFFQGVTRQGAKSFPSQVTYDQMLSQIGYLQISEKLAGSGEAHSLLAVNRRVDIVYHGSTADDLPKLSFDLGPSDTDYWEQLWGRMGPDSDIYGLLQQYCHGQPPYHAAGAVVGSINPLEFWLDKVLAGNTDLVLIDASANSRYVRAPDLLRHVVKLHPAHRQLLVVTRATPSDQLDLGEESRDSVQGVDAAAISETVNMAQVKERVTTRWMQICNPFPGALHEK